MLPRATLSDTGSPMIAAETQEGIARLGILQYRTLPHSPEQNAKQETSWTRIEGRLMPMLEGEPCSPSTCSIPRRRHGSSKSIPARFLGQVKKRNDEPTAAHALFNLIDRCHGKVRMNRSGLSPLVPTGFGSQDRSAPDPRVHVGMT